MKKILAKYSISFVAVLMTASIAYSSTCANYCAPVDTSGVSHGSMSEHSSNASSAASNEMPDEGTSGCKKEVKSEEGEPTGETEGYSCDNEYVVSSNAIILKKTDTVQSDFDGLDKILTVLSFKSIDTFIPLASLEPVITGQVPAYIKNQSFLI